ncbi:phage late control D family protein [Acinetobacter faecalis]|uniref:Contractile injection system protein, VgrG/Pvc8 family n=1 Tax=Acinetobacter faecalis TaxID=2665161 RepID=A0ABU5GJU8_9GAMM|nr:contractile injection system protein, VgrG/Pvc8 family [Acinetobacter faecalis]MDY6550788.1 contractile injection system protein, VgrG/Pvc8 family [Acinetobacter faecalis]
MGLKPCFSVIVNEQDITGIISDLYEYISITDGTGYESDTCEISLIDDPIRPIELPKKGAELRISMGYDLAMVDMGLFIVSEVSLSGPPEKMIIRGRAVPQLTSKNGITSLASQKTRSWPKDTSVSAVVTKIAREHGLDPFVSDAIAKIKLPHFDQSDESDLNFLLRIAKRYDVICKPAGGKLLFVKRGEIALPNLVLAKEQVSDWEMTSSTSDSAGTVIAYWHDKKGAKRKEVKVGNGEPVRRLRHTYQDEKSAYAGAQASLDQSRRGEEKLSLNLPGNPQISAEMPITLVNFREGIAGDWIVEQATHNIDKGVGFKTSIQGVKSVKDADL